MALYGQDMIQFLDAHGEALNLNRSGSSSGSNGNSWYDELHLQLNGKPEKVKLCIPGPALKANLPFVLKDVPVRPPSSERER